VSYCGALKSAWRVALELGDLVSRSRPPWALQLGVERLVVRGALDVVRERVLVGGRGGVLGHLVSTDQVTRLPGNCLSTAAWAGLK